MDENKNNKQGRSMFLYTALIFFVALILIILAFSGHQNLQRVRRDKGAASPDIIQSEAVHDSSDKNGSAEINSILIHANALLSNGKTDEAAGVISKLDNQVLSEEQSILYNQINNQLTQGKE